MTAVLLYTLTMLSSLLLLALGAFVAAMPDGDLAGGLVIAALGATMVIATVGMIVQEYAPRGRTRTLDALYNRDTKAAAEPGPKRSAESPGALPERLRGRAA
ncbi:MAG: hypothetical protein SYC29_17045 [Planctomycetota bacterium]|nr:hypothetical protein [Planctomycetota bacterium]